MDADTAPNSNPNWTSHFDSGTSTPTLRNHAAQQPAAVDTIASGDDAAVDNVSPCQRDVLPRLFDDVVSLHHADLPLLACCFVSGLCDSVTFNATGTFASMQTGAPSSLSLPFFFA